MNVIGLTGSFGTGKSFVASVFKSLGATVLDADRIAHVVERKGSRVYKRIVNAFGKKILDKNKEIDRRRLANIVFNDRKSLDKLNRIVHPEVIKIIKKKIKGVKAKGVVVIDAPLLVEARLAGLADRLVVVKSSRRNQVARCVKKFNMRRADVLKRIGKQISLRRKLDMADFVVDNDGSRSDTKKQVTEIWRRILWR